jgi:hypothetical protein
MQAKDIDNVFNKTIAENFLNHEKEMVIQVQEAFRSPNRQDKENLSMGYYS